MPDAEMVKTILATMFAPPATNVFAVLDGASVKGLLDRLTTDKVEHACLFSGDLAPDYRAAAPHLVKLEAEGRFADWAIGNGWGHHWGVFARTPASLRELRKHFRKFLLVRRPGGNVIYFRWYDPRVLRVYLPTCTPEEREIIFGPVERFLLEDRDPGRLLCGRRDADTADFEVLNLNTSAATQHV
jgi:hypothetical protein